MTDGSENERPSPERDAVFVGRKAVENAIHTGTFCTYQPDRPLRWEL